MSVFSYPRAPEGTTQNTPENLGQVIRQIGGVLNRVLSGKLNNLEEVTLVANAASTTLSDPRLTVNSFISFDPLTANAAAEKAAGTLYVTTANRGNSSFVITHANNAQVDRTFKYQIIG
jgi:hypothetical protein